MEFFGSLYLVLVCLCIRGALLEDPDRGRVIQFALLALGVVSALGGILGFALAARGYPTTMAWAATRAYPYFGHMPRAQGFTRHPNMLASILIACLLVRCGVRRSIRDPAVWLMLCAAVLTGSKELLLLVIGCLVLARRVHWRLRLIGSILILGAFLVLAHFLFLPSQSELNRLAARAFCAPAAFTMLAGRLVVPTVYWVQKDTALKALASSPLVGVGSINSFETGLRSRGLYPPDFPSYDPHCTYTGVLAELGLLGFTSLVALMLTLGWMLRKVAHPVLRLTFGVVLLYFGLEALVTDELNFRHLWIIIGWLAAESASP